MSAVRWNVNQACQLLRDAGITSQPEDRALVGETVAAYVRHLAKVGVVVLGQRSDGRYIQWVEVVGSFQDVAAQKAAHAEEARRRAIERRSAEADARRLQERERAKAQRAADARWAEQLAYSRAKAAERAAATAIRAGAQFTSVCVAMPRKDLKCRRCRWPLDERLAEEGVHIGC